MMAMMGEYDIHGVLLSSVALTLLCVAAYFCTGLYNLMKTQGQA